MSSPDALRRAVAAAQAVLRESESSLIVDGKPGTFTLTAYNKASPAIRSAVDSVMAALGFPASIPGTFEAYKAAVRTAEAAPTTAESKRAIFDLKVVPAITREARRRGLNPANHIAQLALETGYGASTPMLADGTPSYNYGGIKANAVRTGKSVSASTVEFIGGKKQVLKQDFAVFSSPDEFAKTYFEYLFNGPSSYRYKGLEQAKTPLEFGTILQKGGYATDPGYASKFARIADSVSARYSLA